ncbi:PREDICTED: uncharacterized protein LOC109192679 [Ipomoea nil]|uniref:uncharacterized protein LOC109192679 n=1 Tax=Ipomoea nil TaxID=35883 RepID=UPI0009013E25|nr:PREDICTED: uncharacterized protein LOC109192679 [Ipomoea nil]
MNGYQFTWEKGKGTVNWIEERLDKVLATESWCGVVRGASVTNFLTRESDHSALFLGIHDHSRQGGRRKRGFHFEMAWLHDEGCRGVVETAWEDGRNMGFQDCILYCGDRLSRWGDDRFHKFGEQIMNLRKEQLHIRGLTDTASLAEFQHLETKLSSMEAQEDVYWRQRAKQHCLRTPMPTQSSMTGMPLTVEKRIVYLDL